MLQDPTSFIVFQKVFKINYLVSPFYTEALYMLLIRVCVNQRNQNPQTQSSNISTNFHPAARIFH